MDNALHMYGKFKAYLGVVVALVFGIGLIIFSRNRIFDFVNETTATVTETNCSADSCTAKVTANVKGTTYVRDFTLQNPAPATVKLYYTNDTPPEFSTYNSGGSKYARPIMIALAIFMIVLSLIVAYVVTTSKGLGAVYGGVQAAGNVIPNQ